MSKKFQLNKIPFGQMNVINKKMEMYLFLFVPSTCRWNQILAYDWLISLLLMPLFFPEQGSETFFLGIPMVWYLYP